MPFARLTISQLSVLVLCVHALLCVPARCAPRERKAAERFEILLDRPTVVGARAHVDAKGEVHGLTKVTVRVPGSQPTSQKTDRNAHLTAVERVISLDRTGRSAAVEWTVEQFESTEKDGVHVWAKPGDIVQLIMGNDVDEAHATLNGETASAELLSALGVVTTLRHSETPDDAIFGTTERQAVGASWPVHADVASRELSKAAQFDLAVTGSTTVKRKLVLSGVESLEIQSAMTAKSLPNATLPDGSKMVSGNVKASARVVLPVDIKRLNLFQALDMTLELDAETVVPNSPDKVQVQLQNREHHEWTRTTLAPATVP